MDSRKELVDLGIILLCDILGPGSLAIFHLLIQIDMMDDVPRHHSFVMVLSTVRINSKKIIYWLFKTLICL